VTHDILRYIKYSYLLTYSFYLDCIQAYRTSLETQNAVVDGVDGRAASLADLINIAELSMRRVIAMTKQIGAFRSLPQTDQIQLLKSGSIELLILRSVITFDADKQHFLDPVDDEERQVTRGPSSG